MALIYLTQASSGATRNAGTNGDLGVLLDWALPQNGWAVEYSSGFQRIYRAASGNRFRCHIDHNSANSGNAGRAVIRGCESASGAGTFTDAFPTVAQQANTASLCYVSSAANTTTRDFKILVAPTWFMYASRVDGANTWDFVFFGDVPARYGGSDPWNTVMIVGTVASIGNTIFQNVSSRCSALSNVFWVRDITGAVKSTRGCLNVPGNTDGSALLGNTFGQPSARSGYLNQIEMIKIPISCGGVTTSTTNGATAVIYRGWLPNIWAPLHVGIGAVTAQDTWQDTAYNAGAQFSLINTGATQFLILEETDTWSGIPGV